LVTRFKKGEYELKKIGYQTIITMISLSLLLSFPLICIGPMEGEYIMSLEVKSVTVPSAVVWSDNFDDGNISDWNTVGVNATPSPPVFAEANFSTDDGSLRATGPGWNNAWRDSAIAYGTWSFDVDVVDTTENLIFVAFLSTTNFTDIWGMRDYALHFDTGTSPRIGLGWRRRTPTADATDWDLFASKQYPDGLSGWYHIDITRNDDDRFNVYVNGSYAFGLVHDTYTESSYFHFMSPAGPAIDNIVVYDSIELDLVPPIFSRAFEDQTVAAGTDFRYDVNATDSSGIDTATWSVNDTTNFAINTDGVITNAVPLAVGTYNIEVSIDDTWGNTASDTLTVVVETTSVDYTLIAIAAGLGITALVLCVLCFRRRGT
jgi:hypothetical protein